MRAAHMNVNGTPINTAFPSARSLRRLSEATSIYWHLLGDIAEDIQELVDDCQVGGQEFERLLADLNDLTRQLHAVGRECHRLLGLAP